MMERLTADDAGCFVDEHLGQYATARMVLLAGEFGFPGKGVLAIAAKKWACIGPSTAPELTDREEDYLYELSDEVEQWLNENRAPEGFSFGWFDGGFFLWSDQQWNETEGY